MNIAKRRIAHNTEAIIENKMLLDVLVIFLML